MINIRNPSKEHIIKMKKHFERLKRNKKIKHCLHPDKNNCKGKIIRAHSIQNKRVLEKISENGTVYMPISNTGNPFELIGEYGRRVATTFTGFCDYHDKMFQPIEINNFSSDNEEQIFLYIYRAFIFDYHQKLELKKQYEQNQLVDERLKLLSIGNLLALHDLEDDKKYFDRAILDKDYNILKYIVWKFHQPIKFAATGLLSPEEDLDGNFIQSVADESNQLEHLYFSVFPEELSSYIIMAYLDKGKNIFDGLFKQLVTLNYQQKKNFTNYVIIKGTDNLAINPKAWNNTSEIFKESFRYNFKEFEEFFEIPKEKGHQISKMQFDLFEL
ncbi:hypothetical protein D3H64_10085 [Atopobacter sp. AH10]|uniref:hypothetical protein n=1 Tax=Atopobacter sp. AH10 TaxID=2315861 RepID=UPI000EF22A3F|nr:hypothetical protein [Atopobacter sp. AH10]RLK62389.1 hypothetical protein D3H64_10085 [Atopobacter sp. AH10]